MTTTAIYDLHLNPELNYANWSLPVERVLGIDVSRWQDDNSTPQRMDFEKAYAEGARFVFIKASQACWLDEDFIWNWVAAKDAGLYRGAYHYLDWTVPAYQQAEFFCGVIHQDPGELPPVMDYECRTNVPEWACGKALEFIETVDNYFSVRPLIYTSPSYWREFGNMGGGWNEYPLWIANYEVDQPAVPAPWTDWTFWQYTDKGDGIRFGAESYGLDMNWYNGSWSAFKAQFGEIGAEPPVVSDYDRGWKDGHTACKDDVRVRLKKMR